MTSDRQIVSNRSNGARSRGPRTAAGKASSSRNALRHGLAVSVMDEPAMCAEVEALARAIAGNGTDSFQLSQARVIAAAQLDLLRVHSAKVALMNSKIGGAILSGDGTDDVLQNLQSDDARLETRSDNPACGTKLTQELAMVPTIEALQELARLDRYEDRAISRRRRAMRAFLAYQRI
jgi:hypothetical protein